MQLVLRIAYAIRKSATGGHGSPGRGCGGTASLCATPREWISLAGAAMFKELIGGRGLLLAPRYF